ncbi:MAG: glycosyltransferase family A protein [Bacteroidota bacterium]
MPYFSIILPTYNRAHLLPKAIQSVVDQTFGDWELIIVDDGSSDDTKAVVGKFQDERIRYIYQENQERSVARNNGIQNAQGNYICFLDSDDYFLPNKLMGFHEAIQVHEPTNLFYDALAFKTAGKLGEFHLPLKKKEETLHEFLLLNPLGALQLCIPVSALQQEQFNPSLRIGEDAELWLRLANRNEFTAVQSNNTVAVEHDERSVNFLKNNIGLEQRKQLLHIFKKHDYNHINGTIRKRVLSNCYFSIARYFMHKKKYIPSIKWILKSVFTDIRNNQTKHRLYCLSSLLRFKIPQEYKI